MTKVSTFRIPEELKERVAKAVEEDGKTVTEVVIEGLERYLKEREQK